MVKKARPKKKADSPEFVRAYRKEVRRRMNLIYKEREKMGIGKLSFKVIKKKGKIIGYKSLLTEKQRDRLHKLAFTGEQVRKELLEKKKWG